MSPGRKTTRYTLRCQPEMPTRNANIDVAEQEGIILMRKTPKLLPLDALSFHIKKNLL